MMSNIGDLKVEFLRTTLWGDLCLDTFPTITCRTYGKKHSLSEATEELI